MNNILNTILNKTSEAVIISDEKNNITYINKACEDITGYKQEEVLGKNPKFFSSSKVELETFDKIKETLQTNEFYIGELSNRHKNGNTYQIVIKIYKYYEKDEDKFYYYYIFSDISSFDETKDELLTFAYHDTLTKLPNKLKLKAQLEYLINNSKRKNLSFALVHLKLDNFEQVVEQMGYEYVDELLLSFASKFKNTIRLNDILAKVSKDEFIIVLSEIDDYIFVKRVCKKLISITNKPLFQKEMDTEFKASIGISIYPQNGEDEEQLIQNANCARYEVCQNGSNSYEFFSDEMNKRLFEYSKKEEKLELAIKNDDFFIYVQPEIDINTNEVFSLEVLSRWKYEDEVFLPNYFINDLEVSNLIFEFEKLVLQKACTTLKQLHEKGYYNKNISVNISEKNLQYGSLYEDVKMVLDKTSLEAKYLELEFDETSIMQVSSKTLKTLKNLANLGVTLSIDNFGKGFSSFNYLKDCSISKLKIDKSYIDSLLEDSSDEDIISSITNLGKSLGISVIVEGIELPAQDELLKQSSCSKVQGYFYAKPMSMQDFQVWVTKLKKLKN